MAEIQGDVVGIYISTNLVTPAYKEIICAENTGLDGSRDVNSRRTKCGIKKGYGPVSWTMTGTGTHETVLGVNQISAQELIGIVQNETDVLVKIAHVTDATLYYRQGQGQITSYSESANSGDPVTYDFTIDISGDLDITSA